MTQENQPKFFRKEQYLFIVLVSFFVANALIAEFIGVKIFSLEKSLGFSPFQFSLFDESALGFNLTAGVILWPMVFLMTDVINEFYGKKGVQIASFLTSFLIIYAFIMIYIAIQLVPSDFWIKDHLSGMNLNLAFKKIFGQGMWIIIGSLVAFLVGQLLDVITFTQIKKITRSKYIWMRATVSTMVSQLIDSFVVLFIAFYLPENSNWTLSLTLSVALVNYLYKFLIALLLIPLLYLIHGLIEIYLGKDRANQLSKSAVMGNHI